LGWKSFDNDHHRPKTLALVALRFTLPYELPRLMDNAEKSARRGQRASFSTLLGMDDANLAFRYCRGGAGFSLDHHFGEVIEGFGHNQGSPS
jgi:hypothetical protein